MIPSSFFSFFHSKKSQLDNTINLIYTRQNQININFYSIKFLFDYLDKENNAFIEDGKQPINKDTFIYDNLDFLSTAKNQINKYMLDIETLKYVSNNLNIEKNKYLSCSYNHNLNLTRQYYKILIGYTAKDTRQYYAIDKRQNIFKNSDYVNFAYKLFLQHKINIKEFRNFKRRGILSTNLKQRIGIYNTTILNKVSHKKNKTTKAKYTRQEYIFIPKYNRLIRFKKYGTSNIFDLFTIKAIYSEIQNKKNFELNFKNMYSYSLM